VPLSTSDFAGDGDPPSKLQALIGIRGGERELRTLAPVTEEVELIRIRENRSTDQQSAVYSQFATMSHDKATVTHHRIGR
jgi:hypothetical protein